MQVALRYTQRGGMKHGHWVKAALLPLVLALVLAPMVCRAQTGPNPFARDAQALDEGGKLFAASCAPCHGRTGEGGQGHAQGMNPPDLTRGVFKAGARDEDLFAVIAKGALGTGMPSFEPLGADSDLASGYICANLVAVRGHYQRKSRCRRGTVLGQGRLRPMPCRRVERHEPRARSDAGRPAQHCSTPEEFDRGA